VDVTAGRHDELVDVVDDEDRVVDRVTRAQMRAERLRHRVVFIVVNGTDGRLLIHRRSATKDLWPGRWDVAAGGVLGAGEAWEVGARRELEEELGVGGELESLGGGRYEDREVAEIARCYRVVHDGPFRFADGEVVEARWIGRAELDRMVASFPFVPDTRALLLAEVLFPVSAGGDTQAG
jgi:isopentenyldiphosphate isomerase